MRLHGFINWFSKESVVAYARRQGPGNTVFKLQGERNFNIAKTTRVDRWQVPGSDVILHT